MLGSGQQCRPCPCPGYPGTRHYHGSACHADEETHHIVCLCAPGYTGEGQTGTMLQDPSKRAEIPSATPHVPTGPRCDRCSPGYFGTPEMEGGVCRPCQCNNNIDTSDPGACDPHTGHCRRCLYHTAGPRCAQCQPGYFGNALQRSCRRELGRGLWACEVLGWREAEPPAPHGCPPPVGCSCDPRGTLSAHCTAGTCSCDRATGACACRANVVGRSCDRCAPNFWNLGGTEGCQPCGCHAMHATHPACDEVSIPVWVLRPPGVRMSGLSTLLSLQVTGQCRCHLGFGGRVCSQCQENHWGDPELQCRGESFTHGLAVGCMGTWEP